MIMKKLEKIREKLGDRNLSEVSRRSGVKYRTLVDFKNGKHKKLNSEAYILLDGYFNEDEQHK